MASDSPATTIASHSPKKGGFQAAGRRSPGGSLPSKISTEACRSRWKAFLWRNGGEGSRRRSGKAGEGEGTGPRYDAVWPVMLRQKGGDGRSPSADPPQTGQRRNMQQQHHGQGGPLPARCRGGMELRCIPAGQGKRLPAQQPSKQRRPTAMPGTSLQILVRETGLEPVWINRWILSPVRLPIPPLSQR